MSKLNYERRCLFMSDCCLTPTWTVFCYIMTRRYDQMIMSTLYCTTVTRCVRFKYWWLTETAVHGQICRVMRTLTWFRANQTLHLLINVLCFAEKQRIPMHSLWFDTTGIEPTIYCTRFEEANHCLLWNNVTTCVLLNMLTFISLWCVFECYLTMMPLPWHALL
jgi:hypothetical protein